MSDPWPPTFMRTAPPMLPGTPTAHSNPVRPTATVRRATTGRLAAPGHDGGPVDVDLGERLTQLHCNAGEPGVGDEEIGAVADHQRRHAGRTRDLGEPDEFLRRPDLGEPRCPPSTR